MRAAARWVLVFGVLAAVLLVAAAVAPVLFGRSVFIVTGGSMEPAIPLGSALVTEKTHSALIQPGNVITYIDRGSQIVSHRVIERVQDPLGVGFRTKGDANEDADQELVRPVNVLGRVAYHVPLAGYVIHAARQPATRLGALVLAIVVAGSQLQWWALRKTREAEPDDGAILVSATPAVAGDGATSEQPGKSPE